MTISTIDDSQRTAAKVAGLSCLFGMAIVVFANYAIFERLIVPGNVAETARNVMAHELSFRTAIVCNIAYSSTVVVFLTALYVIFRPVNLGLALVGALFRLVFGLMWLVTALNMLGALRLLGTASYLQAFEIDRLQALARIHLAQNFDAYYVGLPFFGLASTVSAYLWLKSRYVPRGLAIFGLISSGWCAFSAFAYLMFPAFGKAINLYTLDTPMALFELALSLWLLVKGLSPANPGH
jgi:hypothetical protein